jgi:hypothetical protein
VWQFLIFVLVWLAFTIIFAGVLALGTLWLQGYLYTEPTTGLLWRAPAAGAAVGLIVAIWCFLNFLAPGDYDPIWKFSPGRKTEFDELQVVHGNEVKKYKKAKDAQGRLKYMDQLGHPPPEHSDEIVVQEEGREVHFKAERWTHGPDKDKFKISQGQSLHYVDEHGRVMYENALGRIDTFRLGVLVLYLGLNVCHLLLWFLCLWLLLRFQWAHALGIAFVLWLVMTLPVMGFLLDKAAALGREQAKHKAPAASLLRGALTARFELKRPTGCA